MNKEEFLLREVQGIRYYTCRIFESMPQVRHGFSTRCCGAPDPKSDSFNLGDVSWDFPARVSENRRRFLSALHLENALLITLHQVHSNHVHIIEDNAGQWNPADGDALVTRVKNAALAVQTADCLPVLIVDPMNNAVAAVHSGWRGTLSRILPRTIRVMQRAFDSDPSTLEIAVGPGIRACCFEVGSEVADLFENEYPGCCSAMDQSGKYHLDLAKVLDIQMNFSGILRHHRHDLAVCTRCKQDEFFSYRAEGPAAGRMMATIGLASDEAGKW
ncbi:MAG: peptidoglycan editing factor PgeF [Acidobacteria bacterium]|nr:peptidoglycan editing factor PgeF [Acidobacteriota bacterium]